MSVLQSLTGRALQAAMRSGVNDWGRHGSDEDHARYAAPVDSKSRRRCYCGCDNRATHCGMANGVCLTTACQLGIQRWVKTGKVKA